MLSRRHALLLPTLVSSSVLSETEPPVRREIARISQVLSAKEPPLLANLVEWADEKIERAIYYIEVTNADKTRESYYITKDEDPNPWKRWVLHDPHKALTQEEWIRIFSAIWRIRRGIRTEFPIAL